MTARIDKGRINKIEILDFLEFNDRWYSIDELSQILNIGYQSVRTHCQSAVTSGLLEETIFYKHNGHHEVGRLHYRFKN